MLEGYKKHIAAVNCRGRNCFLTHLSSLYVSHSVTETEQCCIFIWVFFFYLLCSKHFIVFIKCVVALLIWWVMGHGSVFVWVSGSWVTACDPLFSLVCTVHARIRARGFLGAVGGVATSRIDRLKLTLARTALVVHRAVRSTQRSVY